MIIPGVYDGLWSGYKVEVIFKNGNKSEAFEVNEGIRCVNCKCEVEIKEDGYAYIS
jgi:hypothetical protein